MDPSNRSEPPEIGPSLDPIRAAIQVVADGAATRVTVQLPDARRVLPAARRLALAAGVTVELVEPDRTESDLIVARIAAAAR